MQKSPTKLKVLATSNSFRIEFIKHIGTEDYQPLIKISESLAHDYGARAKLTPNTIQTYFNRQGSLPFIARHQNEIIGYIIGVPLENLSKEPWARMDKNFGEKNTIYTHAFVIKEKFKGNGYAKMLKKVYLNWIKKRADINYVTGHVRKGIASRFKGSIHIIDNIDNWQGTGKTFEYYRRELDPENIYTDT